MLPQKKALVLSGGGGRGAYHVGVMRYLVECGWMQDGIGPDIIAGTSIGSINASALASGLTIDQLEELWLNMHTEDVHRLSDDLPPLSKPLLRWMLRGVLTSEQHHDSLHAKEPDLKHHSFTERMSTLFQSRTFRSLLDTSPWRRTLAKWMDFDRINGPDSPALLLTATELRTGVLRIFCNRDLENHPADDICIDHLMASSSIPIVYPWTNINDYLYWDGAVIANTPLDPVIELAGQSDLDILVVMMTPWHLHQDDQDRAPCDMPKDLVQALTLTLDWAMLASYRSAFRAIEMRNKLAEVGERLEMAARMLTDESIRLEGYLPQRLRLPTVISPKEMMPLDWIIDYEERNHRLLFKMGYEDAQRALAQREQSVEMLS
jgi:NTE family protein